MLVATFYGDHPHHERSAALFSRQTRATGSTAAHCLAEVYAVITGRPVQARASPEQALLLLHDIRERLTLVALDCEEYGQALAHAAELGVAGGGIYDAVIAHCALKVKAQTLYTWNTRHFTRLGPQIASRVKEP